MGFFSKLLKRNDTKVAGMQEEKTAGTEDSQNDDSGKQAVPDNAKTVVNNTVTFLKDNVGPLVATVTASITACVSYLKLSIYLYWKGYFKSLSIDSNMININYSCSINTVIVFSLVILIFFLILIFFYYESKSARIRVNNRINAGIGILRSMIKVWGAYWLAWIIITLELDLGLMLALSMALEWIVQSGAMLVIAIGIFGFELLIIIEIVVFSSDKSSDQKKIVLMAREKKACREIDELTKKIVTIEDAKKAEYRHSFFANIYFFLLSKEKKRFERKKNSLEKKREKYRNQIICEKWKEKRLDKKRKKLDAQIEKLEDKKRVLATDVRKCRKIWKIDRRIAVLCEKNTEVDEKKRERVVVSDKNSIKHAIAKGLLPLLIMVGFLWYSYLFGATAIMQKNSIKVVNDENYMISYSNADKCLLQAIDIYDKDIIVVDASKQKVVELKDVEYSVMEAKKIIISK